MCVSVHESVYTHVQCVYLYIGRERGEREREREREREGGREGRREKESQEYEQVGVPMCQI